MTETQMFSETGGLSCDDASADGQEFHQAAALTCLTSPLTGRQRGEIEVGGGVRACACVYKSQVPPVPADGARAGLSQESSVCVRETEGVRVRARSSGCQRSWTKTGRYF